VALSFSPLMQQLIASLRLLPGIGPKSAQRMAFYLLERNREGGFLLSRSLQLAMQGIGYCQQCRILTEESLCALCDSQHRDRNVMCIVQSPADVAAIEQAGGYNGLYFVLSGPLSPIDGVGPEEIGVNILEERLEAGDIEEVILATNSTVEGEATAFYIADLVKAKGIYVTRIAHGIPLGGELEYVDGGTLAQAMAARGVI